MVDVDIVKSSSFLIKIINDHNITNRIILKIDVEGAEYDIFENLINDSNILDQIDIIIGESHMGLQPIIDFLEPKGFYLEKKGGKGKTQDFLFVKYSC